jgi:hypothetical protein
MSSFSSQTQRKQNTKENKIKKPKEGRELTFKLTFCLLIFGSHFCPPAFALLLLSFHFKCFLLVATFAFPLLVLNFALPFQVLLSSNDGMSTQ